jgi:hypothetical protein
VNRLSQLFEKTYARCAQHSMLKRCVDALPAVKKAARRARNHFYGMERKP